tara:strand:+ start:23316 stop:23723 length:408 start_codon:yes stop_codon:yes gene_type:complete
MKILFWSAGILIGLFLLGLGVVQVASERVEVVEMHTLDDQGEPMVTRLWVVDDEGQQYLRSGNGTSLWFERIQENGNFEVTRNGKTAVYTGVLRRDKRDHINALMHQKYTWGDSLISAVTGASDKAIPVELHPSL